MFDELINQRRNKDIKQHREKQENIRGEGQDSESVSQLSTEPTLDDFDRRVDELKQQGRKRSKVFAVAVVFIILLFISGAAAAGYFYWPEIVRFFEMPTSLPEQIRCPTDTQICPGSSFVRRIPPDCDFAECPPVEDEDYYDSLVEKCNDDSCCLISVERMKMNGFTACYLDGGCRGGYKCNSLRCATSWSWCEPEREENPSASLRTGTKTPLR